MPQTLSEEQLRLAPMREVVFFSPEVVMEKSGDGHAVMRSAERLRPFPGTAGEWLARWKVEAPERTFLCEPTAAGERTISYGQTGRIVARLAGGLLRFDLSAQRPLLILADNGIDNALLTLAAWHIGVPVAPIAPAYALNATVFTKLRGVFSLLQPGLVVVDDAIAYGRALADVLPPNVPLVGLRNAAARAGTLTFEDLQKDGDVAAVAAAASKVGPDTIAKFLFTSGSTGTPKAVINTHRNFCANGQMTLQAHPFLEHEPPVMVDWLPWNHTAGSNSLRLVLCAGGTLHIDRGRPTPALIGRSVERLRRVSPTIYFNVPAGFDALLPYLKSDSELRASLFRRVKFLWYAAASMQPSTWDALERLAVEQCGERILMVSGLGMTETAPLAIFGNPVATGAGVVGVPVPGCEAKLVPHDGKLELRYRGPNVTPGYWRNETGTREAFDADGFFRSGDLLSFVDPKRPTAGMRFEGRISEDFKLATGTRVSAGALRLRALEALRPLANDVVIAGEGRDDIRILIFPDWAACRAAARVDESVQPADLATQPQVRALFVRGLDTMANGQTGASIRIVAAMIVETPPSGAEGELTEKGTINARALLRNRAALIEALFSDPPEKRVLTVSAREAREPADTLHD